MDDELSSEGPQQGVEQDNGLTVTQAGCLFLILSPLIAFVGAMRWNIINKLDPDMAMVMTWFCDTVLLFLLLLPLALARTKSKIVDRFFAAAATKLVITAWIFYVMAIIVFIGAILAAFHYLISLLFVALFGKG